MAARRDFHALFRHHWDRGTGLDRHFPDLARFHGAWNLKTFGDAMAKAGDAPPEAETIRAWREGRQRIQPRNKDAILGCFFPHMRDADAEAVRLAMEAAWGCLPTGRGQNGEEAQGR